VLGSTGSIGTNTLDVVARHPERFEVVALTPPRRWTRCWRSARVRPRWAVMASAAHAAELARKLKENGLPTRWNKPRMLLNQ
jgi:1-deoxy-D-xylulose-5-phosphate reductoisomerase